MKKIGVMGAAMAALLSMAGQAAAQTEIQWWHSMAGELGQKLEGLASRFNESQSEYKVVPLYRGTYPESMTAAIAAFRAGEQPHILQVFEVGTGTFMAARDAVYPVQELMTDTGEAFDPASYLPAVTGYYQTGDGELLSFPFNSSSVILYYNKDAFEAAGLDASVRESQARRHITYAALRNGAYYPWDYQPLQRASERYMRNHMDLNVLEDEKRFPREDA